MDQDVAEKKAMEESIRTLLAASNPTDKEVADFAVNVEGVAKVKEALTEEEEEEASCTRTVVNGEVGTH